jgi:hypothetical protein
MKSFNKLFYNKFWPKAWFAGLCIFSFTILLAIVFSENRANLIASALPVLLLIWGFFYIMKKLYLRMVDINIKKKH